MMNYTTDILNAQFDENSLAVVPGWVKIYRCHPNTREFLGAAMDNVPLGASVVADAYLDAPEIPSAPNLAIVRAPDGQSWLHVSDFRGSVAYDKETKQQTKITDLGKLPDNLTLDAPETQFDKWNGNNWEKDTDAQHVADVEAANQQKAALLAAAQQRITAWQTKLLMGRKLTENESSQLDAWMDYIDALEAVDVSTAPAVKWPMPPA